MDRNLLLILDDDPGALRILSEFGRRYRYEIVATSTVAQFLEAYGQVEPTLIVLDLQYQDSDGIAVMAVLAERGCNTPIVLASGVDSRVLDTARRVGEAQQLKIAGTVSKPIRLAAIGPLLEANREPDDDEWAAEIRAGLEHGQFAVHYQPKVDAPTGRVIGFEALARWTHPERGSIPPDRFIALAEATGTIEPLTAFVLSRAIADCASWSAAGFDGTIAINIAAPLLTTPRILDRLTRVSRQHGFDPSRVVFEVTEGAAMSQPTVTMELLGRLRLHGVSLSLDDFGTGFSNLARLHQMPFNELKIDKRFIIDAASNRDSQVIVRALVGLATSLGLTSVAEGVETAELWTWLRTVGVDQLQGYGIARPMPASNVLGWLREFAPPQICLQEREVA